MNKHKDYAIVCCRTISMIMIVLCHIIARYTFVPGHTFLGQILNAGVFSFLAISGYLFGGKNIVDFKNWFLNRCITLLLPVYFVFFCVLLAGICTGVKYQLFTVIIYLLGLQGLGFLVPGFYNIFEEILVLGPLWFVTVIMLCYCMVPFLQKKRDSASIYEKSLFKRFAIFIIILTVQVVSGIQIAYFVTFAVGYYMASLPHKQLTCISNLITASSVMVGAQILRLGLRTVCDGTMLYQNYVQFSHMTLGLWILLSSITFGFYYPKVTYQIANRKVVLALNDYSFYIYLVHYCYCRGKLNFYQLTDNLFLATIGFVTATAITSIVLKRISEYLQQIVRRVLNNGKII